MINAFTIGAELIMRSNAQTVLNIIAREVGGLRREVTAAEAGLTRVRLAFAALGSFVIARTAYEGIKALVNAAKELNDELSKMKMAGFSDADVAATKAQAWKNALNIPGVATAESAKASRELSAILPDVKEANQASAEFLKVGNIIKAYTGQDVDMKVLARALELRGDLTDPVTGKLSQDRFMAGLTEAMKTIVASGGFITPQALLQSAQTAGPSARMMSAKDYYDQQMAAITDMGGFRAGTALTAASRALIGGIMPQRNAEELIRMDLLHSGNYEVRRGGQVKIAPNGIEGSQMLGDGTGDLHGLYHWVQTVLRPQMESHGYNTPGQQMGELYRLFPTETMRRIVALFLQNSEQVLRDASLRRQVGGINEEQKKLQDTNIGFNEEAVGKAYHNLLNALGDPMTEPAIHFMQELTAAMNALTKLSLEHPQAVRLAAEALVAFMGIFIAGGTVAVGALAFPVISSGLTLLGRALLALSGGPIGALIALTGALAALGSSAETGVNREAIEKLRRDRGSGLMPSAPSDGFGPDGKPTAAPPGDGKRDHSMLRREDMQSPNVHVYVDGHEVASRVAYNMSREFDGPMTGNGDFDRRRTYSPVET